MSPGNMYNVDKEHICRTLIESTERYVGSPGITVINLRGKKENLKVINVDNEEDEVSTLSNSLAVPGMN